MRNIESGYWDQYWNTNNKSLITKIVHFLRKVYFARVFAKFVFANCQAKDKVILEAGCGSAFSLFYLEKLGVKKTIGIDTSKFALKLAKKNSPKSKIMFGDTFDIPLPKKSVDVVFNVGLLEHFDFDEQIKIIKEMRRVSRSYVVNIMPAKSLAMRFIQLVGCWLGRTGTFSDEQIFDQQTFNGLGLKGQSHMMPKAFNITIGHVEKIV